MSLPNCFSFILTWTEKKKKHGRVCLIAQMLLYSALAFPASKAINVCVAKSVWVVRVCLHLMSSPSNSALSVYSFIKPNHPTCCKPQSALPSQWSHFPVADLKAMRIGTEAKRNEALLHLACCRSVMCNVTEGISPSGGYAVVLWNAILKSLMIG